MTEIKESQEFELTGCNWEITLACTLHCEHCGSKAGRARPHELTLDECLSIAKDLISLGCQELTMIGGEVFLYKGWQNIAAFLTDQGAAVNIVTNGYRLGEREVNQIKEARLVNVGLSQDGMETNHNQIRGKSDAFSSLQSSLDLLADNNISTGVITTLMRSNYSDLEEMHEFLIKHNVQVWQIQLVNPMGNLAGREDIILNPDQVKQVIKFIRAKSVDPRIEVVAADSIGYFDENEPYLRGKSSPLCYWSGCTAGLSNVFIDSIGNVKGCGALYDDVFIEGNLREKSLVDIWNNPDAFPYNRKFSIDQLTGRCKGCEASELCRGGCRSSNYFSTGSFFSNAYCSRNIDADVN